MTIEIEHEQILYLPDLRFAKWCEEAFAINRGVYNTIDEKLFEAGYRKVEDRRRAIVSFLQQNVQPVSDKKYYTFGSGKLSVALHQFSNKKFLI